MDWIEEEIAISEIANLLNDYDVEVYSPDGWVNVSLFVDKGDWDEYVLITENGHEVRCNENHLFKTIKLSKIYTQASKDWISAKDILKFQKNNKFKYFSESNGWVYGIIEKTGNKIPIVDIQVNHPNHRYYTNGIESHNTGVGKSLVMCHMAAANLLIGKNVLYITLEMAEERIAERIDANLLDTPISQLALLPKAIYEKKIQKIRDKVPGKLIIKEYPTASAGADNFRYLLNELRLKKKFKPDIIYIDYLGICKSSRIKYSTNVNTYLYMKMIAEEIRGLAVEFDIPILSAIQTNRGGFTDSDPGLEHSADSFGIPFTADLQLVIVSNEELAQLNQLAFKQVKNRYNDPNLYTRFHVGCDRSKMRLLNLEPSAQPKAGAPLPTPQVKHDKSDTPVFDKGNSKYDRKSFEGFK